MPTYFCISKKLFYTQFSPLGKVSLLQNIALTSGIDFTSGSIDMLNKNINLLSAAKLLGETEASNVTSAATGYITITQTLNAPAAVNPGNIGPLFRQHKIYG